MAKVLNTSQFRSKVEQGEGVTVVDFYATWCGPCKMLAPVFESTAEEMKSQASFVKVDIDQSLEIAQQFNISTVPTMVIFKDGVAVEKLVGFMPKEKIIQHVSRHI